jgi:IS5 family transposase
VVNEGKIIDASFVEVPRQRNKVSENEQIKEGKGEDLWKDKPNKKRQKDIDARWTKKDKTTYFGYKNHIKQDGNSKLITKYEVTSAEVHDSNATAPLLDENDRGRIILCRQRIYGQITGRNNQKQRNGKQSL